MDPKQKVHEARQLLREAERQAAELQRQAVAHVREHGEKVYRGCGWDAPEHLATFVRFALCGLGDHSMAWGDDEVEVYSLEGELYAVAFGELHW